MSAEPIPGQAPFLAIAFDLFFLLTFEFVLALVVLVMRNAWAITGAILMATCYLLSVPFRVARWVSRKVEQFAAARHADWEPQEPYAKPAWTAGQEI